MRKETWIDGTPSCKLPRISSRKLENNQDTENTENELVLGLLGNPGIGILVSFMDCKAGIKVFEIPKSDFGLFSDKVI